MCVCDSIYLHLLPYLSSLMCSHAVDCLNLINLDLTNNNLNGSLPPLNGYGYLHIVQLSNNGFSGQVPDEFGRGRFLTTVNLAFNK